MRIVGCIPNSYHRPKGMMQAYLELASKGELKGELYRSNISNPKAMRIGSFHLDIPENVEADVNELIAKMASGELVVEPF